MTTEGDKKMYVQPAAPRPIGGVIDDAIKLYRASFRTCWPIALIASVVSAATVTGTADAILRVLAHDMRHLEDALERIRTSADIERTESIVVLSNLIDRSRAEDVG